MSYEIDRAKGTIITTRKGFFSRKKRTFSVGDLDGVRLLKKAVAVQDGYGTMCYSVVLERGDSALELICTEDEREGAARYRELSDFLAQYK